MLHTIAKINVTEGKSTKDLNWLSKIIFDNQNCRGTNNFPQSLVGDEVVEEISKAFYEQEGLNIKPVLYWGEVHERNMSTQEYCYSNTLSQVSAVLFVSAPEGSGEIVFRPKIDLYSPDFASRSFPIQTGTFYIFPSYLNHYMTRHCSDTKRVSFLINCAIINSNTPQKQSEPVEPPPIVNPGNGLGRFP